MHVVTAPLWQHESFPHIVLTHIWLKASKANSLPLFSTSRSFFKVLNCCESRCLEHSDVFEPQLSREWTSQQPSAWAQRDCSRAKSSISLCRPQLTRWRLKFTTEQLEEDWTAGLKGFSCSTHLHLQAHTSAGDRWTAVFTSALLCDSSRFTNLSVWMPYFWKRKHNAASTGSFSWKRV